MSEYGAAGSAFGGERVSTATIFGQVMSLVGLTLGFLAVGAFIGQDIAFGTARILSFTALGMLFAQMVPALRQGAIGITWLLAIGLVMGLGLGPYLTSVLEAEPDAFIQAAGGTALIVLMMGAWGLGTSKDLVRWMRPLAFAMFGLFALSLIGLFFAPGINASPIFSLAVIGISAGLLVVDFNYVRKHADEDDVVWIATGIFVSIVNIFLSLLNLFSSR
ncbi:MAG: Bax inhibitor-1 family protein [Baekduia sp.]